MNIGEIVGQASRESLSELVKAGMDMRKAQKDYFKFRGSEMLYAAKDAEARFDRALRAVVNVEGPTQPILL